MLVTRCGGCLSPLRRRGNPAPTTPLHPPDGHHPSLTMFRQKSLQRLPVRKKQPASRLHHTITKTLLLTTGTRLYPLFEQSQPAQRQCPIRKGKRREPTKHEARPPGQGNRPVKLLSHLVTKRTIHRLPHHHLSN